MTSRKLIRVYTYIYIAYHVPRFCHSSHALNSHTRPSSETPGLGLLSSSAPPELYEHRACLLDVEEDYTKKKKKKKTEGTCETDGDGGWSEYLVRYTPLTHPAYVPLS